MEKGIGDDIRLLLYALVWGLLAGGLHYVLCRDTTWDAYAPLVAQTCFLLALAYKTCRRWFYRGVALVAGVVGTSLWCLALYQISVCNYFVMSWSPGTLIGVARPAFVAFLLGIAAPVLCLFVGCLKRSTVVALLALPGCVSFVSFAVAAQLATDIWAAAYCFFVALSLSCYFCFYTSFKDVLCRLLHATLGLGTPRDALSGHTEATDGQSAQPWPEYTKTEIFWLNFLVGVARSIGFFVGGTIVIALLVKFVAFLAASFEPVPYFSNILKEILSAVKNTPTK